LFNLQRLLLSQQSFGPANRDLLVSRIGLASKIEIGRKMNDRGDSATPRLADLRERTVHALVGGKIDFLESGRRWQLRRRAKVKSNYPERRSEPIEQSFTDEAAATG
jgi:hypothetical protein